MPWSRMTSRQWQGALEVKSSAPRVHMAGVAAAWNAFGLDADRVGLQALQWEVRSGFARLE